jgi:nitroimidazol reductase NimA-like FMN-containing flavoprotein (pyridoxamine 5'-phosphate oxidase superfamily)
MESSAGSEIPQHVLDYLGEQSTLTLATATKDGEPHAATFLYVSDGIDFYVWLKPSSRTAENVKANSRVGFAIDQYAPDWRQTTGVQGSGRCEVVTGEGIASTAMKFGEKFPDVSPGGSTANIAFYRIRPDELDYIDSSEKDTEEFGFSYRTDRVYSGVGQSPVG